jgi:hypothetical protein
LCPLSSFFGSVFEIVPSSGNMLLRRVSFGAGRRRRSASSVIDPTRRVTWREVVIEAERMASIGRA